MELSNINLTINSTMSPPVVNNTLPPLVDYSVRVIFLLIHVLYVIILLLNKELQLISLIPMHHTNIIGLLTGIHYCIWIAWTHPIFLNQALNNFLCSLSEEFWAMSKYARCYSILGRLI